MYSAAIQRYFNEHIHLPYSFFLAASAFYPTCTQEEGCVHGNRIQLCRAQRG